MHACIHYPISCASSQLVDAWGDSQRVAFPCRWHYICSFCLPETLIHYRVHASSQLVDGETLREWLEPAFTYPDGTGFSLPWELKLLGSYTLRTKDGVMNGYNAEFQMAVR